MNKEIQISLAAARVNKQLTQAKVAEILKVSKTTITSWENGKTIPSGVQFKKLCEIYEIPAEYIFLPCD